MRVPLVVVIAGPNGAGKSTSAPALLRDVLGITTFVNADEIARGLSGFAPERVALEAGRIMLARVHELADQGADFAFETTLSGRTYVKWLRNLRRDNYRVQLEYMWLASPELAVNRVRERVRRGGHSIPELTIRRRYSASLQNFFSLYRPIADSWSFYDNSERGGPRLVATGVVDGEFVVDPVGWRQVTEASNDRS
jgi:predicted ABC-type ATPase